MDCGKRDVVVRGDLLEGGTFAPFLADGDPLRGELGRLCPGSGRPSRPIWSDADGRQACEVCDRFILVINEVMRMRERCALAAEAAGRPAIASAIRALGEDAPDEGV